jgi:hypothetical protein
LLERIGAPQGNGGAPYARQTRYWGQCTCLVTAWMPDGTQSRWRAPLPAVGYGPAPLPSPLFLQSEPIKLKLDELHWKVCSILTRQNNPGRSFQESRSVPTSLRCANLGKSLFSAGCAGCCALPRAAQQVDGIVKPDKAGRNNAFVRRINDGANHAARFIAVPVAVPVGICSTQSALIRPAIKTSSSHSPPAWRLGHLRSPRDRVQTGWGRILSRRGQFKSDTRWCHQVNVIMLHRMPHKVCSMLNSRDKFFARDRQRLLQATGRGAEWFAL